MNRSVEVVTWGVSIVLCFAILVGGIVWGMTLTNRTATERMKACVASGKSWHHVGNGRYECTR